MDEQHRTARRQTDGSSLPAVLLGLLAMAIVLLTSGEHEPDREQEPRACNHRIGAECDPEHIHMPPAPSEARKPDWCSSDPTGCRRYMEWQWDRAG